MKVLLVGNLAEDRQESMRRFTDLLDGGLRARGHDTQQIAPTLRVARLIRPYRYGGLPKYLGYVDKFLLFPRQLRRHIRQNRPDVVHITDHSNAVYLSAVDRVPALVTCHDLLQIRAARGEIPQQSVGRAGRAYQNWILSHLARAPRIACVSSKTRSDVLAITRLAPERVSVVPNALNYPYRPLAATEARARIAALAASRGVEAKRLTPEHGGFVLNVGAAHWYKNRPGLLSIYAALRAQLATPPLLVMVGAPLSETDAALARKLGVDAHLVLFPAVSSEQLEAFYSVAEALIFPSWEEGFGWPLAEAQACGCPVFTSSRSPMTEVGGRSAVYFDPKDPVDAARIIATAWSTRTAQRSLGLEEARRWEPAEMFSAYEKIYQEMRATASSALALSQAEVR
jgi:glycosyltransferase involved in cell wall biosynthesis